MERTSIPFSPPSSNTAGCSAISRRFSAASVALQHPIRVQLNRELPSVIFRFKCKNKHEVIRHANLESVRMTCVIWKEMQKLDVITKDFFVETDLPCPVYPACPGYATMDHFYQAIKYWLFEAFQQGFNTPEKVAKTATEWAWVLCQVLKYGPEDLASDEYVRLMEWMTFRLPSLAEGKKLESLSIFLQSVQVEAINAVTGESRTHAPIRDTINVLELRSSHRHDRATQRREIYAETQTAWTQFLARLPDITRWDIYDLDEEDEYRDLMADIAGDLEMAIGATTRQIHLGARRNRFLQRDDPPAQTWYGALYVKNLSLNPAAIEKLATHIDSERQAIQRDIEQIRTVFQTMRHEYVNPPAAATSEELACGFIKRPSRVVTDEVLVQAVEGLFHRAVALQDSCCSLDDLLWADNIGERLDDD